MSGSHCGDLPAENTRGALHLISRVDVIDVKQLESQRLEGRLRIMALRLALHTTCLGRPECGPVNARKKLEPVLQAFVGKVG